MADITPATTVRDLLQSHPALFDVLAGHGMCEDCRISPPPVSLEHFATKHCAGDVTGLIGEIEAAIIGN